MDSAAAGWSAIHIWEMIDVDMEASTASRQTAALQAQYREVTRLFPKAPTSAENLRKAVEISQKLQRTLRTPEPMFRLVSEALEESPTIVVRELSWRYGVGVLDRSGSGTAAQEGTASPGVGSPGQQTQRRQSGLIEGEVRPFRGDFRAAIDSINAFADRLAKNPAVAEVRIVKLPLNVNPTLSLTGTTLESGAAPGNADFQLIIVLRPAA